MVKLAKYEKDIEIESGVTFTVDGKTITAEGPKGKVQEDFTHARDVNIIHDKDNNKIIVRSLFPRTKNVALANTLLNLIQNMQIGVLKQFTYKMKLVYSHFPPTLVPPKRGEKKILIKNFIGERAPRITYAHGDVEIKANKEEVIITGCSKADVGQTAANIQRTTRIRDKDKRRFQDGIFVFEKIVGDETYWKIK